MWILWEKDDIVNRNLGPKNSGKYSTHFSRKILKVGATLSENWYHISMSMKVSPYFERRTQFERKILLS